MVPSGGSGSSGGRSRRYLLPAHLRLAGHPRQRMPNPIGRSGAGAGVETVVPLFARPFDFDFGTEEDEKEGRPSCVPTLGAADEGILCTDLPPRRCQSCLCSHPVGPLRGSASSLRLPSQCGTSSMWLPFSCSAPGCACPLAFHHRTSLLPPHSGFCQLHAQCRVRMAFAFSSPISHFTCRPVEYVSWIHVYKARANLV